MRCFALACLLSAVLLTPAIADVLQLTLSDPTNGVDFHQDTNGPRTLWARLGPPP